jgi:hypothetical protein
MLVFEQIRAGGDRNFGYLLGDRDAGVAALIDPSYSPDGFAERAREQGCGSRTSSTRTATRITSTAT